MSSDQTKRLLKRAWQVMLLIVLLMLLFVVSITIYGSSHKEEFGALIIDEMTTNTNALVEFDEIAISPLMQFPNLSIAFKNFSLKEKSSDNKSVPIINIKVFRLGLNVWDLFHNKFNVRNFVLEDGVVDLSSDQDDKLKLLTVFRTKNDSLTQETNETENHNIEEGNDDNSLSFSVENMAIKNIELRYEDVNAQKNYRIVINKLIASYVPIETMLAGKVTSSIVFKEGGKYLRPLIGEEMQLNTQFEYNKNDSIINLEYGDLTIGNMGFNCNGNVDFSTRQWLDLTLEAKGSDLSFASLILSDSGLSNVEKGDVYFKASVKDSYKDQMPNFTAVFGIHSMEIKIPRTGSAVSDLNISGRFESGRKEDFSNAELQIDTIYGQLPDGYIHGRINIQNLNNPRLLYNVDLQTNLLGFDQIIDQNTITNLNGQLQFSDRFIGVNGWDFSSDDYSNEGFKAVFKAVSFSIPNIINVKALNGEIRGEMDSLSINQLSVVSDSSDLVINGNVTGVDELLENQEALLLADLKIKGKQFNFPYSLRFDPTIGRSFPYPLKDLDLDFTASISTEKGKKGTPKMGFDIKSFSCQPQGFLPYLKMSDGVLHLERQNGHGSLKFDHFNIDIGGSKAKVDLSIFRDANNTRHYSLQSSLMNFNPAVINSNYLPELDTSKVYLSGNLNIDLQTSKDSVERTGKVKLNADNVKVLTKQDTVSVDSVLLKFQQIAIPVKGNLLSSGLASGRIRIKNFDSDLLHLTEVAATVGLQNGTIEGDSICFANLGQNNFSKLTYKADKEKPVINVISDVGGVQLSKLFKVLKSDTIMSGAVDLNLDINSTGKDLKELISNLDGKVALRGNDMILYGVEMDPLIKKFMKSQNFNLVDIGAVVLTGPLGIVVTKGTAYTRLLTSETGENTKIQMLNSSWHFVNGELILDDVAFATEENRVAAHGKCNLNTEDINIRVALVDNQGCIIVSQDIEGTISDPQLGKINIINKILAPVTNLIGEAFSAKCDPFYTGSVKHSGMN